MATWSAKDLVAELCNIQERVAGNVIQLIDEDCTLPFVARYRKKATDDMPLEMLRRVFQAYDDVKKLQKTIESAISSFRKSGVLTDDLAFSLGQCHSKDEVEQVCAPFKSGNNSKTLAGRARELGLETYALRVLNNEFVDVADLSREVSHAAKDALSHADIMQHLQNLMADIIAKDLEVQKFISDQSKRADIHLISTRVKAKSVKATCTKTSKQVKKAADSEAKGQEDPFKFETYFEFQCRLRLVKPHQVLAINRGEKLGYLKVKVTIPDAVEQGYKQYCSNRWLKQQHQRPPELNKLVTSTIDYAYERLICPALQRRYRSQLKVSAELASTASFASNLRHLLLTPPVRGKIIMGLDPGFRNGCKYAVISKTGDILETGVFFLVGSQVTEMEQQKMCSSVIRHRVEVIALGGGTASRETEAIISKAINRQPLYPMGVKYCIVSEDGASIYSCSKEAEKEMPNLDPNVRSAVSIARRLQDPLAELVKIDPMHLGVGMYQHDISKTALKSSLDMIVQECVSFVGVDLNSASTALLRHIAGLSDAKAAAIIEFRSKNGAFVSRNQLLHLRGFGAKTFQQCAGFVRVYPSPLLGSVEVSETDYLSAEINPVVGRLAVTGAVLTESSLWTSNAKRKLGAADLGGSVSGSKRRKAASKAATIESDLFDATIIHPESYQLADNLLKKTGALKCDLGRPDFIRAVADFAKSLVPHAVCRLAEELKTDEHTIHHLLSALQQRLGDDCRTDFNTPLFRSAVMDITELKCGQVMTGVVKNVVDFGAFIDVGVGVNGLLHISKTRGQSIQLGQRVEVTVENVDVPRKRIALALTHCQ